MKPRLRRVNGAAVLVAALAAGALTLASCASPAVVASGPRLSGTPAISISVPLSTVGCTLNDVCVAVGTASTSVGPTMVAEFGTPHGNWFNLTLPAATSPLITSSACLGGQCLLGGSVPGNDLLWRFSASGDTLATSPVPSGGIGVDAMTCHLEHCSLVDTDATNGVPRFSFSSDGGDTWSTPAVMSWASGDAVTSLTCGEVDECLVGARTATHSFVLERTLDGGTTWTAQATPAAWTNVTSLSCEQRACVALASSSSGSLLARSSDFAKKWHTTTLSEQANALACVTSSSCVVVGRRANGDAWLASVRDATSTNASLRYVPTPLLGVACGSKLCAAIGVTTLLSVPITP